MNHLCSFEDWREVLRQDCAKWDKLKAFNVMGEYVLRLLYDHGIDPSVEAIVANGAHEREQRAA